MENCDKVISALKNPFESFINASEYYWVFYLLFQRAYPLLAHFTWYTNIVGACTNSVKINIKHMPAGKELRSRGCGRGGTLINEME